MPILDRLPSASHLHAAKADNTIWVAEDNLGVRMFLLRAFKRTDPSLQLIFFSNGAELTHYAHDHPVLPRLLLLDLEMPVMNGLDTLRGMRENCSWLKSPVIIFSSLENPDMIRTAYFYGATLYLKKPMTLDAFNDVAELCTNCSDALHSLPANALPFGALEPKHALELVCDLPSLPHRRSGRRSQHLVPSISNGISAHSWH
jgi:two-component system response regulator